MMRALIFLAFAVLAALARAETTVSIGVTHSHLQASGIWWQKEFEHRLPKDVPSASVRVGVTEHIGLSFTHVGRFVSHAKALASDQAYDAWNKKGEPPFPISDWYGTQTVQALAVTWRERRGRWFLEAGPAIVRSTWVMDIPNWEMCWPDPACLKPGGMLPLKVGVPNQRSVELVLSSGYELTRSLAARVALYPTRIGGEFPGITKGYSTTLTLDYTF